VSLPATLLLRPYQPSTPLHILKVRTAATAPTRDCIQLASSAVYECEMAAQCGSDGGRLPPDCDLALHVVSVELSLGPNMEYCERLHWWPALSETQTSALLPWVVEEEGKTERRRHQRKKDKGKHESKRKHSDRRRARKHKSSGSLKQSSRRRTSEDEKEDGVEEEEKKEQEPAATGKPSRRKDTLPPLPSSDSPCPSSSSSSSSQSAASSPPMRYPPCCTCGPRTTCSRSKFCRCVAAGQRCGHCASDFCENDPKSKPYQRSTIVSRQVVQQYQRAMKQQTGRMEKADRNGAEVEESERLSEEDVEMEMEAAEEKVDDSNRA